MLLICHSHKAQVHLSSTLDTIPAAFALDLLECSYEERVLLTALCQKEQSRESLCQNQNPRKRNSAQHVRLKMKENHFCLVTYEEGAQL